MKACEEWEKIVEQAFGGDDPALRFVMEVSEARDELFEEYKVEKLTTLVMSVVEFVKVNQEDWLDVTTAWEEYTSAETVGFTAALALTSAMLVSM